jgi:hypothetical protein
LGHLAVFYSGEVDTPLVYELVDIAIDLALTFKCSPFEFMDVPPRSLYMLRQRTNVVIKKMQQD